MPYTSESVIEEKRVRVMGILNVTPDSFSDGGSFFTKTDIAAQITAMIAEGADIIDVGGESTRPFADPVTLDDELARVIPAIRMIRETHSTIPISIDTTKSQVARSAIEAGATIVNDISAFHFDPQMINIVRDASVPVILMHMQGTPADMQKNPMYEDVINETSSFLRERVHWAVEHGIDRKKIILDPGIGFGKTVSHNLTIIKHLDDFMPLGCPLLIGHSRKSFIGKLLALEVNERDIATAALSALCAAKGAAIIRVHNVKATVQAVRMVEAVQNAQ